MIYSVWWYVLAGFMLGFILSTLWEWLYFRRRRMRIENQRIAELEAAVRSLSTTSQSVEATTSSGFAAGYQSPMVFLEGEEDDVDTVEVIVPAPPEPLDFDQSLAGQTVPVEPPRSETQFVAARQAPAERLPASNGNGVPREAPSEPPKVEPLTVAAARPQGAQSALSPAAFAAGAAAAAAVLTRDEDQPTEAPYPQELPVTELPAAEVPGAGVSVAEAPAAEAPVAEAPVAEMPGSETSGDSVPPKLAAQEQTSQEIADRALAPEAAQPAVAQAMPAQALPLQSDRQNTEEDAGLTPAGMAVLVSALASQLGDKQPPPPEASQQPAPAVDPPAPPPAEVPASEPSAESAPAARVMPGVYDVPDAPAEQRTDPAARTGSGITAANADPIPAPAEEDPAVATAEPAAAPVVDSGTAPQAATPQAQEPALPLRAILPRAAKPAPLTKSGQPKREEAVQASALAASGLEPELEQVSNQLDDLIKSINGLIERTQPLLDQPVGRAPAAETPSTPAIPAAMDDYSAADDLGSEEDADTGVTGPYSAQNLSRMEYGFVQLLQAVRRVGRDVRSAF